MNPPSDSPAAVSASPDELFAQVRAGFQALRHLLEVKRDYLQAIAVQHMPDVLSPRLGASDVVQDALVQIINHLNGATGGLFSLGAEADLNRWLGEVCRNAMAGAWRRETRDMRDVTATGPFADGAEVAAATPTPSSECRAAERDELLAEAIGRLPEIDRVLIRLSAIHGWSYPALAGLLDGRPSDAGKQRVRRRIHSLNLQLAREESLKDLR